MSRHVKFWIVFASLVVISSMSLAACQPAATSTQVPIALQATTAPQSATVAPTIKRGGTLVIGRPEEPATFDPPLPGENGSIYEIVQVMDTLTRADAIGSGIEPGLAKSWDVSADKLTYTFHLRDAKFSNGNPVTAADVVFSLNRAVSESTSGYMFTMVDTIQALDDKTVKITLKWVYSPFLSIMSLYSGSIVPKAYYEADPEGFSTKPIGSGPFMVQEYTRGEQVVLVKNPNYWEIGEDGQPLPYLDKVIIKYVPENTSRILGFRNNDYDVMLIVPFNEADNFKAMKDVTLEVRSIYRLDYLYINESKPPLDKREFRLALNYATNRKAIFDIVYFGYGEIPNGYMPKMNFWSPDVPLIPYDPNKAKELLTQAGYKGEVIQIILSAGNTNSKQIATMLQQNWAEVGINSEIREEEGGTQWDDVTNGNYMVSVDYITSDINDDDELAVIQAGGSISGENSFYTWYDNPKVTELLSKARVASDPAERAGYYKQVQEIVYYQDAYSIPFNFVPVTNSYYNYVHNWRTLSTGWWWLKNIWVDK